MSGVLNFCLTLDASGLLKGVDQAQAAMERMVACAKLMSGELLYDLPHVQVALSGIDRKFAGVGLGLGEMFEAQISALAAQVHQINATPIDSAFFDAARSQLPSHKMALELPGNDEAASLQSQDLPKTVAPADKVRLPGAGDFDHPTLDLGHVFAAMNTQMKGTLEAFVRHSPGLESYGFVKFPGEGNPVSAANGHEAPTMPVGHYGAFQIPPFSDSDLSKLRMVIGGGGHQTESSHLAQAVAGTNKSIANLTALVAQQTAVLKEIANGVRHNHLNLE